MALREATGRDWGVKPWMGCSLLSGSDVAELGSDFLSSDPTGGCGDSDSGSPTTSIACPGFPWKHGRRLGLGTELGSFVFLNPYLGSSPCISGHFPCQLLSSAIPVRRSHLNLKPCYVLILSSFLIT